jgi:hypothetical protein
MFTNREQKYWLSISKPNLRGHIHSEELYGGEGKAGRF